MSQNKFKRNLRFNFLMVFSEMRKFVNAPACTWGSISVGFSPSEELDAFPLQFASDFVSWKEKKINYEHNENQIKSLMALWFG